ncbi:hypothetical protein D3C72_2114870 [compost metagenome]
MAVLTSVDRDHAADRHTDLARRAGEAGLELDEVVAQLQRAGRVEADVQHDLAVLHVLARHLDGVVDQHRDIGREPVVGAPLVQRPDEVRAGGRGLERVDHEKRRKTKEASTQLTYFRMTFSEGVSASM